MSGSSAGNRTGDVFAFDLNRWRYRWQAIFYAVATLIVGPIAATLPGFGSAFVVLIAALQILGLISVLKILSLDDPILVIDQRGVFDKRVTREVVPWEKIRRVEVLHWYWSSVRIDVGNRRQAGVALAPWTYLGSLRYGIVAWDDIVINPQGLSSAPDSSYDVLAERIATHVEALRVRFAGPRKPVV